MLSDFLSLFLRKVEYLRRIGNLKEVEDCRNADKDLIKKLNQQAEQVQFNTWKDNVSTTIDNRFHLRFVLSCFISFISL